MNGKLKEAFANNEAVRAICEHMAKRERNQTETKLDRIVKYIALDGWDLKRSDLIIAFRVLEEASCGKYVEGRRGWPSRFVWHVKSLHVLASAKGKEELEPDVEVQPKPEVCEDEYELIEHSFYLRPDLQVTLELPVDLSKHEAARLVTFIESLPFEDEI